jgi:hypothetical protein
MMYVGTGFLPGWLVELWPVLSDPFHLVRCSGSLMGIQRPILGAVAAALLLPQAAQAATLAPLGACYRSVDAQTRESVPVRGSGFTPGETVTVSIDGVVVRDDVTVLSTGEVVGAVQAPYQASGERAFTLTVTENNQPANTASTPSRVTALDLRLSPRRAAPSKRVRFLGRGFTDGTAVYAHYVRGGKHRRTVSLGAPRGACGTVNVKRRQIPISKPRTGRWTLQVDNAPDYSSAPAGVFVRLAITVRKVLRPTPRR